MVVDFEKNTYFTRGDNKFISKELYFKKNLKNTIIVNLLD